MGVYEGNYFLNDPTVVASGFVGRLYSSEWSDWSQCAAYLGRNCVANRLSNSGPFNYDNTDILTLFSTRQRLLLPPRPRQFNPRCDQILRLCSFRGQMTSCMLYLSGILYILNIYV